MSSYDSTEDSFNADQASIENILYKKNWKIDG